jgi:hypothetical protein
MISAGSALPIAINAVRIEAGGNLSARYSGIAVNAVDFWAVGGSAQKSNKVTPI